MSFEEMRWTIPIPHLLMMRQLRRKAGSSYYYCRWLPYLLSNNKYNIVVSSARVMDNLVGTY
eukprot:scaffold19281_cov74-Skeletonema_menzelii.AAC.1